MKNSSSERGLASSEIQGLTCHIGPIDATTTLSSPSSSLVPSPLVGVLIRRSCLVRASGARDLGPGWRGKESPFRPGPRHRIRTKDLWPADEALYGCAGCSGTTQIMAPESRTQVHSDEEIPLCDGTYSLVRPVSRDDGPALGEIHRHLSGRAHFPRYFPKGPVLTFDEIKQLTCVDGWNHVTLVAETNGALIALGRYDRLSGPRQAQVAFRGSRRLPTPIHRIRTPASTGACRPDGRRVTVEGRGVARECNDAGGL